MSKKVRNTYKGIQPSYKKEDFGCHCDYFSKEEMAYANPGPGSRYIIDTCCKSSEKFFNQDRNVEGFKYCDPTLSSSKQQCPKGYACKSYDNVGT